MSGQVVEQWPVKMLNEVCDVSRGKTITRKQTVEGNVPVVAGGIKSSYSHNIANRPANVITVSGSGANAGFVNFWTTPIFASDCSTILPLEPEKLEVRFVYYAMLNLQNYISTELRRGAAQPHVYAKDLALIEIPIPPLEIQQRIVSTLDKTFEKISISQKNSESEFNAASNLLESHINSIFENPSNSWKDTILGETSERVCVGFVGSTSKHYRDEGVLFLRTKNVGRTGEVNLDDVKYITKEFHDSTKKSQLKSGDVILSRVVTDRINCAFIPEGFPEANCANVVIVRPGLAVDSRFLVYYIKSQTSQNYLLSKRKGSAQLVVNTTIVKQWPVKIPSIEVQQKIVQELDVMVQQISELMEISRNKSQHYLKLKQSILQEAFNGTL